MDQNVKVSGNMHIFCALIQNRTALNQSSSWIWVPMIVRLRGFAHALTIKCIQYCKF